MSKKLTYEELEQRVRELEKKYLIRRRSEENFRKSEETARALLNATSDSAILIDTEGQIIAINEIAVYRLGRTDTKVVRMNLFDMFPPDIAKERKKRIDMVARSGEPINFDDEINGCLFNNTYYPLFDGRGKVERLAIYSRDITYQKRAEETRQLAEQMKLVGEWAMGLAQEIRNSLAGIKVSVEVLLEEHNVPAEDKTIVLKALGEINRIETLLKKLLNFAKTPEPQLTDVDINDLLDKTITPFLKHPHLSSSPPQLIEISKDFDKNLPALAADPIQLQQVFLNIFFNAIDAMPDGGILSVRSIYDEPAKAIQIKLSDTGKGIKKGMIDDIFEPFFTTKPKGSGLGLAIAKRVVELHGGVISAKSDPGKKTTFSVYLPLAKP